MNPSPLHMRFASRLSDFWSRPVFTVAGVEFHGIDAALSAMVRGDWSRFERRLSEGLACAAWADENGEPSADDLEAAATRFRYARDLISADEMNAWLERHHISLDEWTDFLRREQLWQSPPGDIDDIHERYQPSSGSLVQSATVEGVCSDAFAQHETTFMRRVALVHEPLPDALSRRETDVSEDAAARLIRTYAHWLSLLPAAETMRRARQVLAIEATYEAAEQAVMTQAALAEVLEHNRLEWRLVETETVVFGSEPAAREGLLCIVSDGMSLEEVAALSRQSVNRQTRLVEELEADHAERLASADAGTLIGPTIVAGGVEVSRVIRCAPPSFDEPRVASRARAAVIDRAAALAVRTHVRLVSADQAL